MPAIKGRPVLSRRSRVTLTCTVCGTQYEQHSYRAETSKYCSKACWSNRTPLKPCLNCGKAFKPISNTRTVYCSRKCSTAHRVGENAPAWKDGKSLDRERARMSYKLSGWRKSVFKRDDYTCQQCGAQGVHLHAHHIKPFSEFTDLRLDVSNGITLCVSCHGDVHGKDFSNRHTKVCPDCGITTKGKGKGGRCKSCGLKHGYATRSTSRHPAEQGRLL